MRILIFEGICTSGKSSIIKILKKTLSENGSPCRVVTEGRIKKTLRSNMEITKSIRLVEKDFLKNIHGENIFFDRLYLSLVSRCKEPNILFKDLEKRIIKYKASIVFLYVPPKYIRSRLSGALVHRKTRWQVYLDSIGGIETATKYYINQQRKLLRYLKLCEVPHIIYNTKSKDYKNIAGHIYKTLLK